MALHNYGPDDVPDVRPRPLDELVAQAQTANDHRVAAQEQRGDHARAHLDEAGMIADRIRECTGGIRAHFGLTNVRLWRLETDVELGEGAAVRSYC